MPEEDLVELKFRLYDGSDIGPFRYSPAATVAMLKERIVAEWPKGQRFDLLFSYSLFFPGDFDALIYLSTKFINYQLYALLGFSEIVLEANTYASMFRTHTILDYRVLETKQFIEMLTLDYRESSFRYFSTGYFGIHWLAMAKFHTMQVCQYKQKV